MGSDPFSLNEIMLTRKTELGFISHYKASLTILQTLQLLAGVGSWLWSIASVIKVQLGITLSG